MAKPDLGKMYGPLPLGAWVALIAGGLAIAFFYNRNQQSKATGEEPVEEEEAGGMPGVGTGQVGGWVNTAPPQSASTDPVAAPQDNDEWGRLATNRLVAQGYDGSTVQSAITKYLYGDPNVRMSVQETAIINLAIRQLGAPPQPPTGSPITPVPGPNPVPGPGLPPPTQSGRPAAPRLRVAPTQLKVGGVRSTTLQLNVNGLIGATKYQWFMKGRSGFVTTTQPVVVITNLRPGRSYTFTVRAANSAGVSPMSRPVVGTTSRS